MHNIKPNAGALGEPDVFIPAYDRPWFKFDASSLLEMKQQI